MSATTSSSREAPDPTGKAPDAGPVKILDWLPWEKILIWGLFFLLVYTLRDFFFIIFMTFITAYIMRSAVRRIARFVLPNRDSTALERTLSVGGFAVLLFGLYAAGNYLGPELYRQGGALVQRVTQVEPEKMLNDFLTKSVGSYLFYRQHGRRSDSKYQEKFKEFQKPDPGAAAFETFPELMKSLEERFELEEGQKIKARLNDKQFEAWFIREKAPELFRQNREALILKWEQLYEDAVVSVGLPLLAERKKETDFEHFRDQKVKEGIFRDLDKEPEQRAKLRAEWETLAVKSGLDVLRGTGEHEQRFQDFYARLRSVETPAAHDLRPPYDFSKYEELRAAHGKGEEAFAAAVRDVVPADEKAREEEWHAAFELRETKQLMATWMAGDVYKRIKEAATDFVSSTVKALGGWVQQAIGYIVTIPIQLALSLLISFFITLDIPRLKKGILSLKQSRARDFYEEIAPGLYNFGRLIGRAFQAQGVIALFNTLLTFVAIRGLGIQNEVFLCAIVFVCSFIPVLGVVLSGVPISIMAIVQPGGTLLLALEAIAAILVIHFIETSLLNPKILGEMLHLHPVLVLAVLAIGEHYFKVWGLLLAVPVTVYIIRCVILNEEIPGLIEADPLARVTSAGLARTPVPEPPSPLEPPGPKLSESARRTPEQPISVP